MTDNEIILFKHDEFGEIRTLNINDEPWFVGKDVVQILGYADLKHAVLDHVDAEDRVNSKTRGQNNPEFGQRGTWLINESGLYGLILSSKLPSAKKFKHWVTAVVLPSLRKHGAYITAETLHKTMSDPRELAKLLTTLADEQDNRRKLEEENAFLSVKAKYYGSTPKIVEIIKKVWYNIREGVDENDRRFYKYGREKFKPERALVCKRNRISPERTCDTYFS